MGEYVKKFCNTRVEGKSCELEARTTAVHMTTQSTQSHRLIPSVVRSLNNQDTIHSRSATGQSLANPRISVKTPVQSPPLGIAPSSAPPAGAPGAAHFVPHRSRVSDRSHQRNQYPSRPSRLPCPTPKNSCISGIQKRPSGESVG